MTIKEISGNLEKGDCSAVQVAKFFIDKIKSENNNNFSFITLCENFAIEQARIADERINKGEKNTLLGIPGAIKDNIMVKGVKCTAGSATLSNYQAVYNATVSEKIIKDGSVILGKTNMDEFAMGSSTESSAFGITKNPYDLSRVPGGSSGGSAVAVASGLCSFAIGSDTGGSIRQPASFCGVVGLKPTYGSVSRYGLIAMASSLDQIGTLTRNIDDAVDVFKVISGKDPFDSTSSDYVFKKEEMDVSKLKIGIPKEYFIEGLDKKIEVRIKEVIKSISKLGAEVKEISLPHTDYALPVYYIIMSSEVSTNMNRYDGLRYGFSEKKIENIIESYFTNRGKSLGMEVKRRIILGTFTLSAGYQDAYYKRALQVRSFIKNDFTDAFQNVDIILTPTSSTLPFKIGEKVDDPLSMYLSDIFTATANLAGLPAVSVPCGLINGLPVGIQIIGRHFEENKILGIGKIIENLWKI